jgi:hypothetical protein
MDHLSQIAVDFYKRLKRKYSPHEKKDSTHSIYFNAVALRV